MTPSPGWPGRVACRAGALLIVLLAATATPASLVAAQIVPPAPTESPDAECREPESYPLPGQELYRGTDPSRNLLLYNPERIMQYPCPYPREFRGVIVDPHQVTMVEGGQLVRRIRLGPEGTSTSYTLPRLATIIGDPSWIAEVEPGVFQIDTAVQQRESTLVVAAPAVREVRMTTRPHVYMGGSRATAVFEGVKVTSWDPAANGPDLDPVNGRPFLNYEQASRFDITRSEFVHLGSDRTGGYGVSWRRGGTTGVVVDSVFAHSFFGVYTFEASDLEFRRNVFRDNAYYGLDPHTATAGVIVEDNEAYGNGTHGMIFSQSVTDGALRNNRVHDNGGSGIVLHAGSDRNIIEGNVVERNHEDGIVVIGSGENTIQRNTVAGNRTGIRINDLGSNRNRVLDNVVQGNHVGLKAYGGATETLLADNAVTDTTETGIVVEAPLSRVVGNHIAGARRGLELDSVVDVSGTEISDVQEGIRARPSAIIDVRNVKVTAHTTGARLERGAVSNLRDVQLNAPTAVAHGVGGSSSWTEYLPFVGIGAVILAIALDVLRRARNRHQPQVQAPPHVLNSA